VEEILVTWTGLSAWRRTALVATLSFALLLVSLSIAGQSIHPSNAVLVFLLATLLISASFGFKVSLIAALISDAVLIFFFFEPIFQFWAHDVQLRITLGIFLLASVVAGAALQERSSISQPSMPGKLGEPVLEIDLDKHVVRLGGIELALTRSEFKLLLFLAENAGKVLTHERILVNVWGEDYGGDTQKLRTYVKQLRSKLGDDRATPRFIRTEPGIGYRFMELPKTIYPAPREIRLTRTQEEP
jgi:DNA-binding winged helix-turn-helix (wHTH) protein